jgi:hypothetical protein
LEVKCVTVATGYQQRSHSAGDTAGSIRRFRSRRDALLPAQLREVDVGTEMLVPFAEQVSPEADGAATWLPER